MSGRRSFAWLALLLSLLWLDTVSAQATITRVGATLGYAARTNDRTVSIPGPPAGVLVNDLLLTVLSISGPQLSTVSAPPGWQVASQSIHPAHNQLIYYKVAAAGEAGPYTFSWNFPGSAAGNDRSMANMLAYRGVDPLAPIAAAAAQFEDFAGSQVTAPSITPPVANTRLVGFFALDRSGGDPVTLPAGMGNGLSFITGAGPGGITLTSADQAWPTATATGSRTASFSASSRRNGQLIALRPLTTMVLDHIRIEHSGNALTCEPTSITLRACADATCSSAYTDPVSVTLAPAAGWSANPVSFTETTMLTLSITSPQSVLLDATATPAPIGPTQCYVGATPTCTLSFADTGFVFSTIDPQIAGTASSATLRAVTTADDGTSCTAAIPAGDHAIEFASQCLNPATCAGREVSIGAQPIAGNPAAGVSAYTAVTLTFDGNAQASFSHAYPDVGALQLHARYTVANGALLSGNSNTYVVRPAAFRVDEIRRDADGFANPAATDATGAMFIGAGQAFRARVSALTSAGAVTPNFGREAPPQGVELAATLVGPAGGAVPALSGSSAIAGASFGAGIATVTDLAWGETGIIRLSPSVAGGSYLGSGAVSGNDSEPVGRFVPDHFDVVLTDGCLGAGFTYASQASGQPFTATVTARNAAGATTTNHGGAWARATTLTVANGVVGSLTGDVIAASDFVLGTGVATKPDVGFRFGSVPQPPTALSLRAIDTDGVSSLGFTEGTTELRNGRLRIGNAAGSELEPLDLPLQVETWQEVGVGSGVFGWVAEGADGCTVLNQSDFTLAPGAPATISGLAFANGSGALTLSPTGSGNADVTAVLDAPAPGLAPWLQFDWDGDNAVQNPVARAGFGLNAGKSRQIYRREVIN